MALPTGNPPTQPVANGAEPSPAVRKAFGERTLRHLLHESHQLDWQEVVNLGIQVGEALAAYHARGRCPHGAVSPDNIFLADEGATYRLGPPSAQIQPAYCPPEVLHAGPERPDASSDVYSLGVVLYEALAGNHCLPFHVQQRLTGSQPTPEWTFTPARDSRLALAHVPPALRRTIEQATRLIPANRFATVSQFTEALHTLSTAPGTRKRTEPSGRSRALTSRLKLALGLAVVLGILVVASSLLVYPYFLNSPASQEMHVARAEALAASAPNLAPREWEKAEQHSPANDFASRLRLYRAARDEAWKNLHKRVADAEKEALAFEAGGEPLFSRAHDARQRAEQLWTLARFAEAIHQLKEAEEFFLAARANRRERLTTALEQQLDEELPKIRQHLDAEHSATLLGRLEDMRAAIRRADATLADLNRLEQQVADLRQQVAAALQEAGAKAEVRRSAEEALAVTEAERATALSLRQGFPGVAASVERGEAFLTSAREALEQDPARAIALADAARERFRAARNVAERELTGQRQAANKARRRAQQAGAEGLAEAEWSEGQNSYQRGEAAQKSGDLVAAAGAFAAATRAFDTARQKAEEEEERREQAARAAATARAIEREVRVQPTPAAPPSTPAIAAVPPPVAPPPQPRASKEVKELGPMPPLLAQAIQNWLAEHCRALDRSSMVSHGRRARCDHLTVLDRRDPSKVEVSFQLATGQIAADGIRWDRTDTRVVTLDCSSTSCRCVAGEGC